jgi:uncharacterized phage protein gp47/JayE
VAVIRPEIETDPAELEQIAIQYLMDALPGWEPAPGDLMTWLISAHAQMIAEERDIAADVPLAQILRPFGEHVYLLPPKLALPATVRATVTMRDRAGYKVPAGTEVLVRTAGDDGVTMVVVRDARTEPDRAETVEVQLEAAPGREGSAGNRLDRDNEVVPLRALEFIRSIRIADDAVSSGGRDAETDEEYLERLVDTLALASPTPILPQDFAAIARQVDGVDRALAINLMVSRPMIVEYFMSFPAFSGYLVDGSGHVSMSWGDGGTPTASEIRAQLEQVVPVAVTGTYPQFTLVFPADDRDWSEFRLTDEDYNGPAVDGWTVVQQPEYEIAAERAVTVAIVGEDGALPAPEVIRSVQATLESMREVNWRISVIGPTYTEIMVDFKAVAWPDHDVGTVRDAAVAAITAYLSPANWGRASGGDASGDATWVLEPVVRYLEVAQVLNDVPGVRYIEHLRIATGSGAWGTADVTLAGRAPLPVPKKNGITGTVIGG